MGATQCSAVPYGPPPLLPPISAFRSTTVGAGSRGGSCLIGGRPSRLTWLGVQSRRAHLTRTRGVAVPHVTPGTTPWARTMPSHARAA